MELYHGTNMRFKEIDLSKSKQGKDFGKGFYLSADYKQAEVMAITKVNQLGGEQTILSYSFDEKLFDSNELKVKRFEGYSQEWAEFVFANRSSTSPMPAHDYDIVIGPIANDRVGLQIRRFMEHDIDINTFLNKLKYMKGVTTQYFFGTEKATALLKPIDAK
ncbi:DUF3990 domain-containing protein [Palleniella muris]|uniref:DUF3990 domain-containing protein n=1 Tax=Palleniella muris TaxID=3038145 RepID=A0AC61QSZ7_9BACT|nr:DUF3990 domain-containing protein [Palleniella muris]TGX83183.1 DUF3990 domain-containing protein [Palleniella muris]